MIQKILVGQISLFTLDSSYKWLKARKLYLNPKKCTVLTNKKNKPFDPIVLLIRKTKILTVKVFKGLGIYISENLKRNEHTIIYKMLDKFHPFKHQKVLKLVQLLF